MIDPLRTISHSERGCFNDCRALWAARYLHGHVPLYSHPVKRLGALFEAACAGVANVIAWIDQYTHGQGDLHELQTAIEHQDGWNWEQRVEETLHRLHLEPRPWSASCPAATASA